MLSRGPLMLHLAGVQGMRYFTGLPASFRAAVNHPAASRLLLRLRAARGLANLWLAAARPALRAGGRRPVGAGYRPAGAATAGRPGRSAARRPAAAGRRPGSSSGSGRSAFRGMSTSITVTSTRCCTRTTSFGSFTNRSASWLTWHQPVLVDADVDERPERRHVRDDPGQLHARLDVLDLVHPLGELERLELLARGRGRAWPARPRCRSASAGRPCRSRTSLVDPLAERLVPHQVLDGDAEVLGHPVDDP
jgi:hypothetical protein